jgi:hypothetical protein
MRENGACGHQRLPKNVDSAAKVPTVPSAAADAGAVVRPATARLRSRPSCGRGAFSSFVGAAERHVGLL